jgi:hypothetical protein
MAALEERHSLVGHHALERRAVLERLVALGEAPSHKLADADKGDPGALDLVNNLLVKQDAGAWRDHDVLCAGLELFGVLLGDLGKASGTGRASMGAPDAGKGLGDVVEVDPASQDVVAGDASDGLVSVKGLGPQALGGMANEDAIKGLVELVPRSQLGDEGLEEGHQRAHDPLAVASDRLAVDRGGVAGSLSRSRPGLNSGEATMSLRMRLRRPGTMILASVERKVGTTVTPSLRTTWFRSWPHGPSSSETGRWTTWFRTEVSCNGCSC